MQNINGLDYQRITDVRVLKTGDFVHKIDENDRITRLRVLYPYDEIEQGVMCLRLGRGVANRHVRLKRTDLAISTILRATSIPASGIPGTWCDRLDSNGNVCGRRLLHQGDCRGREGDVL